MRRLVPAETLESSATQQVQPVAGPGPGAGALVPSGHPQLAPARHRTAPHPFTTPWNDRARHWRWEVNLIASKQINAFCMPGRQIAFFTGILDQLRLTDEAAMIMGHEMAHAAASTPASAWQDQATNLGLRLGAQLLGLGDVGRLAANLGGQLLAQSSAAVTRQRPTWWAWAGCPCGLPARRQREACGEDGPGHGRQDGLAFLSTPQRARPHP